MDLSIRSGDAADIALLQALQVRSGSLFRDAGMHAVADNPPSDESTFRESIAAGLLHVAVRHNQIVGFALALEHGLDCHLEQMSVDPASRRQGVGSALLRHLIDLARVRRCARMTLSTFTHLRWNAPFYAGFNFVQVPDSDLTPALVDVRNSEAAAGLDMSLRTIMALQFGVSPEP